MATCSECGLKVVKFVLTIIANKNITLPGEISLQSISRETGYTPKLIGSSFDDYIKGALFDNFLIVKKAGKPCRLQIRSRKTNI